LTIQSFANGLNRTISKLFANATKGIPWELVGFVLWTKID